MRSVRRHEDAALREPGSRQTHDGSHYIANKKDPCPLVVESAFRPGGAAVQHRQPGRAAGPNSG